jgi:hypothetical protein
VLESIGAEHHNDRYNEKVWSNTQQSSSLRQIMDETIVRSDTVSPICGHLSRNMIQYIDSSLYLAMGALKIPNKLIIIVS